MSVFNVGIFKGPHYSSFDWSHGNRISVDAGKINVIGWDYLNTGDKFVLNDISDVIRQMPMLAPTMDTYRCDVHAFAVRLRSIGHVSRNPWVYEDFFNVQGNVDGSAKLPSLPLGLLFSANGFRNGTLYEQLGFPTFKKDRDDYLSWLRIHYPWVFDPVVSYFNIPISGVSPSNGYLLPASFPSYNDLVDDVRDGYPFAMPTGSLPKYQLGGIDYYNPAPGPSLSVRGTLVYYIMQKYPEVFSDVDDFYQVFTSHETLGYGISYNSGAPEVFERFVGTNLLEKVYEFYKIDAISVIHDFEDWLLDGFLGLLKNGTASTASYAANYLNLYGYDFDSVFNVLCSVLIAAFPDLPNSTTTVGFGDKDIPAYPVLSYIKIISDWFINTAISQPDSWFINNSMDDIRLVDAGLSPYQWRSILTQMNQLCYRYWDNDYFTSAFPTAQVGSAVGIPVNGTIIDLRNANALQKLRERLLYAGSRIRDVWFAIWGKKTSSAILEMSEVIGAWSNDINVDSVMQTSQGDAFSPLAQYAGVGLGYRSGSKGCVYHAEEPTVIMFVASIKPRASYFQGLSRKFLRANLYDYAIPQLANVGEQEIKIGELYLGSDSSLAPTAQTFGFTRRNGDMMWTPDEVHGDFRGSLDYWHNARIFGSKPSLSTSFLEIRPVEDNLNRVFAVQSDSYNHFLCHFRFDGYIVRSLPKHVVYDL